MGRKDLFYLLCKVIMRCVPSGHHTWIQLVHTNCFQVNFTVVSLIFALSSVVSLTDLASTFLSQLDNKGFISGAISTIYLSHKAGFGKVS